MLECLNHDLLGCVSHSCVEEHGVFGRMIVRNWEHEMVVVVRAEVVLVGRIVCVVGSDVSFVARVRARQVHVLEVVAYLANAVRRGSLPS